MEDNDMICNCMGLTVRDIKDAIDNGAKSFDDVQEATQVATGCGACEESVRELVDELLAEK
ncbi:MULTISPECIES: (2Fe-2S)-binding protein [Clostridium]|uniref:Bacterioferritin-associated ferredoxin n=1 Tax=Clostridium cibarium TaxID=2762247 RepID=A0ABR8PWQ3_9CLOT|nr:MULTISPECIES: (2Fe-2S)-binding protein [Clostridium]MBD7912569.1 (2Fe-2S)-binding protein [Clostridium cibarium]